MSSEKAQVRSSMVWRVAARDLLSTLRDRRTLISSILLPLLIIPLIYLGLPLLMGKLIGGQAETRQKVGVIGTLPPVLREALSKDEVVGGKARRAGVELVPVSDPQEAVRSKQVEAVLKVNRPLPQQAGKGTAQLELYTKLGNMRAETGAMAKVEAVVKDYNRQLALEQLKKAGLSEQVLSSVVLKPIDVSTVQESKSGQLAFVIPMLMLQFILSGAMATALDATAGEKERGTLESLLVSPVRRSEVVVGKLVATTLTALVSACFSVLGFLAAGLASSLLMPRLFGAGDTAQLVQSFGGQLSFDPGSLLALIVIALSSAFLISALLIALSIYARSYKEAQTYVTPLSLLIVFPAIMLQFADFLQVNNAVYGLPVIGSLLAILDIVRGSITLPHAVMALLGNLVGTLLLCLWALRSFGKEEVIFRN